MIIKIQIEDKGRIIMVQEEVDLEEKDSPVVDQKKRSTKYYIHRAIDRIMLLMK